MKKSAEKRSFNAGKSCHDVSIFNVVFCVPKCILRLADIWKFQAVPAGCSVWRKQRLSLYNGILAETKLGRLLSAHSVGIFIFGGSDDRTHI